MDGEAYYNPDFLKLYEGRGSAMHVSEAERKSLQLEAFKQVPEDARVRLDRADLAGDHGAAEQLQELEPALRQRKSLAGKVAEHEQRHTPPVQRLEDGHAALDRALHHLVEAGAEGVDERPMLGIFPLEQRRRLGEPAAGVLALVPILGADGRQERLHRRLVAGEELPVEMPRIPIDQHAEIEHDDGAGRGQMSGLQEWAELQRSLRP